MDHGMLTPDIGTTVSLLVNMLSSSFIYLGIIFWDPLSCFVFFYFFLIVQVEYFLLYVLIFQRRQWHPTPVLLPGKSHGRRSLVGCSPWGRVESDMAKRLHFHFSLLCIGEGNGNPLQGSCLENPRDGVAQSQTQLK